jgi:hypothetical protein
MLRLTLLLTLVGLLIATAATASTPAQYRAAMNAICRSYTPLLQKEKGDLKSSRASGGSRNSPSRRTQNC